MVREDLDRLAMMIPLLVWMLDSLEVCVREMGATANQARDA